MELEYPRVECEAFCDFFELLEVEVTVTVGAVTLLLCSGLEFPFDSSPIDDEGGVGGKPKPNLQKCFHKSINQKRMF